MKINKLTPSGFCGGVNKALKILDEAIDNPNTPKPIYLLGSIIHNSIIIDEYISKGVILIDDSNKSRLELLDEINNGTVIFSAHGVSHKVYQKALDKGLNIIDTTCSNVSIIHKRIIDRLNNGYTCIYIGNKKHPECEGVLGIDSSIILLSNIDDVNNLSVNNDKILFGTDAPYGDYKEEIEFIKNLNLDKEILEKITRTNAQKVFNIGENNGK